MSVFNNMTLDTCNLLFKPQESLGGMTKEQFGGLLQRLVRFTSQNLRNLVSDMNLAAFMENLGDINKVGILIMLKWL